jgi:hypothetical protein
MIRFREFIKQQPFSYSLREDEAAPAMGSGSSAPTNPDNKTTNKHHPEVIGKEFGIRDEDFSAALETDSVTLYGTKIPDFGWDYRVAGPIQVSIEDRGDGGYEVTFPLAMMYQDNPKLFIRKYKEGENPMYWDGQVDDQTEYMTQEQLMDAWVEPFAGMGGDPMGGGGMGAPPMGGMGGGMGGPPMGGM